MRYQLCDPQLVPLASPDGRALALFETDNEAWCYLGTQPGRVFDVVLGIEVVKAPRGAERDTSDLFVA